jgi:predicted esterase
MHLLGPKYAGDSVSFKIKRGDMELAFDKVVLGGSSVAGLQPAWLGVLPVRDDPEIGVEVRHVFENSPAAKAGLKPGDRILKVNGAPFSGRDQYFQRFSTMQPGEQIKLGVRRKESEKEEELSAKLAEFGVEIPTGKLPPGSAGKALTPRKPAPDPNVKPVKPPIGKPIVKPDEKPAPKPTAKPKEIRKGLIREKDETTGHEFWLLVPESYDPNRSHALVVWLHPAGNTMEERMQKLWGEAAKQHDLIVLAPLAENPTGWLTSESDVVRQDIQFVLANYSIDRQRVVAHGQGNGGNFAFFLGFDARDQIRGVATIGGVLSNQVKDLLPTQRLGFYVLAGGKDPVLGGIRASVPKLKEKKYPVHFQELPELGSGYLPDANKFQELLRWIDSLDRL